LDNIGSTFIRVIERYAQQLQANGGKLYLTGVHPRVLEQLELTETTETIPEEAIYLAEDKLGASTKDAFQSAQTWLEEVKSEQDDNSGSKKDGEGDSNT
jgi:SulP family sulfate permease